MSLFINVLIAEDNKDIVDKLKNILSKINKIKTLYVVNNGIDAYKYILNKKVDFALIEFNLNMMGASELLKLLKKENIESNIIVLASNSKNDELNNKLLDLGAFAVVNKNANINYLEKELIDIIIKNNREQIKNFNIKKEIDKDITNKEIDTIKNQVKTLPYNINKINNAIRYIENFKPPKLLAIGVSTGGPKALRIIIPSFPKEFPIPILISQHIPKYFSDSLAKGLNDVSQIYVKEAEENEEIKAGFAYICPGENNMGVYLDDNKKIRIRLIPDLKLELPYAPSVNYLFNTINNILDGEAIAVIMTGMGNDGTEGMINLHKNGNLTIAQDERTCTIFGMPKSVIENKAATFVMSLYDIAEFLIQYTRIKLK